MHSQSPGGPSIPPYHKQGPGGQPGNAPANNNKAGPPLPGFMGETPPAAVPTQNRPAAGAGVLHSEAQTRQASYKAPEVPHGRQDARWQEVPQKWQQAARVLATPPDGQHAAKPYTTPKVGKTQKKKLGLFGWFSPSEWKDNKKQAAMDISIVVLAVSLVIFMVLGTILPYFLQRQSINALGGIPVSTPPGSYNKDANSLPVSQLVGTVLPETEDAGPEYVQETLFIGDSNTARFMEYTDITGCTLENTIGIESMGIQAVTSLRCVQFYGGGLVTIPEAVEIMQPRRIVITFGTNDAGGLSPDSFVAAYKEALAALHTAYPHADIIIGAVPPVAQYNTSGYITMDTIDAYNVALAKMAGAEGHKFLNWTEAIKDESTGYAKEGYMLSADGIHISRTGTEAMMEYVRTHSYITEDTRPKPLATIPQRVYVRSPLLGSEYEDAPASSSSYVEEGVTSSPAVEGPTGNETSPDPPPSTSPPAPSSSAPAVQDPPSAPPVETEPQPPAPPPDSVPNPQPPAEDPPADEG